MSHLEIWCRDSIVHVSHPNDGVKMFEVVAVFLCDLSDFFLRRHTNKMRLALRLIINLLQNKLFVDALELLVALFEIRQMCFQVTIDEKHPGVAQLKTYAFRTFVGHYFAHTDGKYHIGDVAQVWCQIRFHNNNQMCRRKWNAIDHHVPLLPVFRVKVVHDEGVKFFHAREDHWLCNRPHRLLRTQNVHIVLHVIFPKKLVHHAPVWHLTLHVPGCRHNFYVVG